MKFWVNILSKKLAVISTLILLSFACNFAYERVMSDSAEITSEGYPAVEGKVACKPKWWRDGNCIGGCQQPSKVSDPYYVGVTQVRIYVIDAGKVQGYSDLLQKEELGEIVRQAYIRRFSKLPENQHETTYPGCFGRKNQPVINVTSDLDYQSIVDMNNTSPRGSDEKGVLNVLVNIDNTFTDIRDLSPNKPSPYQDFTISEIRGDIGFYLRPKSGVNFQFSKERLSQLTAEDITNLIYRMIE